MLAPPPPAAAQPAAAAAAASLTLGGPAGVRPWGAASPGASAGAGAVAAIARMISAAAPTAAPGPHASGGSISKARAQQWTTAVVRARCFTTPARTPPPPINQALKVGFAGVGKWIVE
jgi:hypothetical protein